MLLNDLVSLARESDADDAIEAMIQFVGVDNVEHGTHIDDF